MVRLALAILLLAASFGSSGTEVAQPLVIAGLGVAAALVATLLLDTLWLGRDEAATP
jgi:hypothetical protein